MAEAKAQWGMPETAGEVAEGPQEPQEDEQTEPYPAGSGQTPSGADITLQVGRQWEY